MFFKKYKKEINDLKEELKKSNLSTSTYKFLYEREAIKKNNLEKENQKLKNDIDLYIAELNKYKKGCFKKGQTPWNKGVKNAKTKK